MKCCLNPHLMDETDADCGCIIEACFNCNDWRMIRFCSLHNPEGENQ